ERSCFPSLFRFGAPGRFFMSIANTAAMNDIGKNIVGVVLACNNFEVIDLGVMVPTNKILEEAKKHKVDIIGLSGLITPSLDEMVHVAKEMEREGFQTPLLIGGATTSRIHTAVKVAPGYSGAAIHVLDASRSVPVCMNLLGKNSTEFKEQIRSEYDKAREVHLAKRSDKRFVPIKEARDKKPQINLNGSIPKAPSFTGTRVFEDFPLDQLVDYIDWTPFFHTWELRGSYPRIMEDKTYGTEATKLFNDAQKMLREVIAAKKLTAKAVIGFWPANAEGDDVLLSSEFGVGSSKSESPEVGKSGGTEATGTYNLKPTTFNFLRQQAEKAQGEPYYALADFIAQKETGVKDHFGGFVVTAGIGLDELAAEYEAAHDDYSSIMIKAIADRLAEAFAEKMHELVRKEYWGYAKDETLDNAELIREKYQGIRPAPGYPACPDHTEKSKLFEVLDAGRIGVELTESFAMYPASSVSGFYFAHPESKYFNVGKIGKDQVEDYALRKGMSVEEMERWLAPNLNYEPAAVSSESGV
ncbi:MAG: cobalamin-dependent protein, partial [Mucilaginibacter polytrichastri]|nr:cobalamin-dependent protein [Mucilaginibacter polytrichastri]